MIEVNLIYRWAPDDDMDRQPNYLKFVFKFIVDCFEEFEREMMLEGNSYCVEATKKEVSCQTYSCKFQDSRSNTFILDIAL